MTEPDRYSELDELLGWSAAHRSTRPEVLSAVTAAVSALAPHVPDWWESQEAPIRDIARTLGSAGLLGMLVPGDSGSVRTPLEYGLVCAALEGLDSGIRTFASVQGSLAMEAIHRFGSDAARNRWLPGLRSGELIGGFALTEPEVGSDPSAINTTAVAAAAGIVLNGTKRWVTNGASADVIVTWARTESGISAFAVPTDLPGVTATWIPGKASLRVSETAEVRFDDVRLAPGDHLVGARGVRSALECLNEARFGIIFGSTGAARDSLIAALTYTMARNQFGRPLAGFQLTQSKLAWATSEVARSWQLALSIAEDKAAGTLAPARISLGKYANVRSALAVAREMRTLLGANGTLLAHSPIRHAANLESVLSYEGTEEMHALIVGRHLTGIPAF